MRVCDVGLAISNAIALHIHYAEQGDLSPPANSVDKDLQPLTARPAGGHIVCPPPRFTCAAISIDVGLNICPTRHLLPTTNTFLDLDLFFYAGNSHLQHCRTNFKDAACHWNNNVPPSLSSFYEDTHPHVGITLASHRPTQHLPPVVLARLWNWSLPNIALRKQAHTYLLI